MQWKYIWWILIILAWLCFFGGGITLMEFGHMWLGFLSLVVGSVICIWGLVRVSRHDEYRSKKIEDEINRMDDELNNEIDSELTNEKKDN